jgi:hypothetical protein
MDQEKKSSIEEAVKYLPYVSAIVYFFGFIIFTAHLASFGIYEFNLLNFQYLKAGMTFFIIFIPAILIVTHNIKNPTDKLVDIKNDLKAAVYYLLFYLFLTCMILFRKTPVNKLVHISSLIYFLLLFVSTSYAARNWPKKLKIAILILPIVAFILFIFIAKEWAILTFIIIFQLFVCNILWLYFDYGDKNFNPFSITCSVMSIILLTTIFGSLFYKEIPYYLGGIKKRNIILFFKEENKNNLDHSPIKDSLNETQTKRLNLIYENENLYYLLLSDSTTVALKKELFIGELIKTTN